MKMNDDSHGASPKRVGITFCGGCNQSYDRVALAGNIRDAVSGRRDLVYSSNGPFDAVIVICGCDCACADTEGFGRARILTVRRFLTADEVLSMLGDLFGQQDG